MILAEPHKKIVAFSSHYDAASTTTDADWGIFFRGIAAEEYYFNGSARLLALGRIRREIRNNPYLAGLVNNYPQAIGYSNMRSRTTSRDYNSKKDLWWYRLSKNITNAGDSLRTLETIVTRELLIAGEVFLVLLSSGKVQVIASEFCGSPAHSIMPDGSEINGIAYDAGGRPTSYRFGRTNPLGVMTFEDAAQIPARYVIHIFDKDRVQMGRGLPWLLPSIKTARDLYEIVRSKTKQIKDANSFSGWLEKEGAAEFLKGLDKGQPADSLEKPTDPADKNATQPVTIELKAGTFVGLEPGEKLNQLMSQYHANDYRDLIMLMLHAMSSPVGLPVELWYSGLGDVSYSGFKGLGTQWDGRRRAVTQFLEDRFLAPMQFWRVSKAANEGDLPANPDKDDDLVDWAWKRTPVLDEEKNAKANQLKLASGEVSLADVWEEKGLYPEEIFSHRRQLWIKMQIAAGNLTDGDPKNDEVKVPEIFMLRGLLPGEKSFSTLAPSNSPASDAAPSSEAKATPPPAAPPEEAKTGGMK